MQVINAERPKLLRKRFSSHLICSYAWYAMESSLNKSPCADGKLVGKRISLEANTSNLSQFPLSDPLNPLNLTPVEPRQAAKLSTPSSEKNPREDPSSIPTSVQLPLRLNMLANSNTNRLLETRKCRLPCFILSQYPNPDFIGRQSVLDSMDKQLLPRETQGLVNVQDIRLFALCGMGGIGKTDLAAEYAYSRRHRYGAIFWLEAAGVSQLASDFGRISVQLGLESPNEAKDLEASIEIAKAWLTKPRSTEDGENDSWLLIFDNADNLDIITNYIPHNGSGSILVTSRDPFAKEQYSSNGTGIDLEPLPMNESATLLRKLVTRSEVAKNADEQDASIDLAKQLDGLPLAMTQIAGFIRRRRLLIREFANLYATDARYAEMHHVSNPVQDHRYGHTLATAYNFRDLKTPAWRLLQLLAFMNADRIREDIFFNHELANDQDSTSWTASTFENARYELLASSIIKRNIDKKELWIHRVIQTEVRTSIDTDHLYQNFRDVVTLLAQLWPPGDLCSQVGKRWALCEDLMPHLERLYQLYVEYSKSWFDFEIDLAFPTLLNEAAV